MKHLLILLLISASCRAQVPVFSLPPLDSLFASVDRYFEAMTEAQLYQLKQDNKARWLNYLPSPGYSPFQGGFTVNFNVAAPIQESKARRQIKAQGEAIRQQNNIARQQLRNEVWAGYIRLERLITNFRSREKVEEIRRKLLAIVQAQYDRKEITPTAYLTKLQEEQLYSQNRENEAAVITEEILLLLVKAKRSPML